MDTYPESKSRLSRRNRWMTLALAFLLAALFIIFAQSRVTTGRFLLYFANNTLNWIVALIMLLICIAIVIGVYKLAAVLTRQHDWMPNISPIVGAILIAIGLTILWLGSLTFIFWEHKSTTSSNDHTYHLACNIFSNIFSGFEQGTDACIIYECDSALGIFCTGKHQFGTYAYDHMEIADGSLRIWRPDGAWNVREERVDEITFPLDD